MKLFKQFNWKILRISYFPVKVLNRRRRKRHFRYVNTVEPKMESFGDEEEILSDRQKGFKWLRRATKNDLMYDGSFNQAVVPVLLIGQLFAIMPVQGLKSSTVTQLTFEWFSLHVAYSLFIFAGLCFYFYLTIRFVATNHFILIAFDPVVFYGSAICIFVIFVNLARKWPGLMKRWHEVECALPKYQSQLRKAAMAHKFKMIAIIVLMCSLTEHLLHIIVGIHNANYCYPQGDIFESFSRIHLYHIFTVTEYSRTKAIVGKFINIISVFIWSYMDMFVMIVSEGLCDKFRQINENMLRVKGKNVSEEFWREHRLHYRSICDLCEEVDDAISGITMVSFSNNLYFICVQLLKSLHPEPSFAHTMYFWFSMMFLFCRTVAVSLYTSRINDESKKPFEIFRCVPNESWCLEVKRFSQEVTSEVVALTGMRFFQLTRGLLCSVAGAIVTYELVLFQFNVYSGMGDECQASLLQN